jgi:hypothetical protein
VKVRLAVDRKGQKRNRRKRGLVGQRQLVRRRRRKISREGVCVSGGMLRGYARGVGLVEG